MANEGSNTEVHSSKQFLVERLVAALAVTPQEVSEAPNLSEVGLDSFGFIDLVSRLEGRFQIEFSVDELESLTTLSLHDISALVREKQGNT